MSLNLDFNLSNKLYKISLTAIFILFFSCFSQITLADSSVEKKIEEASSLKETHPHKALQILQTIEAEFHDETPAKFKVQTYQMLARTNYLINQFDKANHYADRVVQIAKEKGDLTEKASALTTTAHILSSMGNLEKSLTLHRQAIDIREQLLEEKPSKEHRRALASAISNLGYIEYTLGYAADSLQRQVKAEQLLKDNYTNRELAMVYQRFSLIHLFLASQESETTLLEQEQAIKYLKKAIALDVPEGRGHAFWSLSQLNINIAEIYADSGNLDLAKKYLEYSKLEKNESSNFTKIQIIQIEAYILELQNNLEDAKSITEFALEESKRLGLSSFTSSSLRIQLGRILYKQKQFNKSYDIYLNLYALAKNSNSRYLLNHVLKYKYLLEKELNDEKRALATYEEYQILLKEKENSVNTERVKIQLADYDFENKELELKALNAEIKQKEVEFNNLLLFILLGGTLIIVLWRFRVHRLKTGYLQQKISERTTEIEKQNLQIASTLR